MIYATVNSITGSLGSTTNVWLFVIDFITESIRGIQVVTRTAIRPVMDTEHLVRNR